MTSPAIASPLHEEEFFIFAMPVMLSPKATKQGITNKTPSHNDKTEATNPAMPKPLGDFWQAEG